MTRSYKIRIFRWVSWTAWMGLCLFFANPTWADFYLNRWESQGESTGTLRLIPQTRYVTSDANFDSAGTLRIPAQFSSYSRIQTDLSARYGLPSQFSVFARLGWAYIDVGQFQTNSTTATHSSAFGLTDSSVGAHWRAVTLPNDFSLGLQVQADFPLYSNTSSYNKGIPFMGDGSADFTGGLFASIPFFKRNQSAFVASGGVGFTYRTSGYSLALPWSVDLKLIQAQQGVELGLGVAGLHSLGTDLTVEGVRVAGDAGSLFTGAINPRLATVRLDAGYRFSPRISLQATGSSLFLGQNAPRHYALGALIQIALFPGSSASEHSRPAPQEYGRSNQGFITYQQEAKVLRVNDRLNLLKINIGTDHGTAVGQTWDIFSVSNQGTAQEAVARAKVTQVKADETALEIVEYYKEIWIEEGFIAKKPLVEIQK